MSSEVGINTVPQCLLLPRLWDVVPIQFKPESSLFPFKVKVRVSTVSVTQDVPGLGLKLGDIDGCPEVVICNLLGFDKWVIVTHDVLNSIVVPELLVEMVKQKYLLVQLHIRILRTLVLDLREVVCSAVRRTGWRRPDVVPPIKDMFA